MRTRVQPTADRKELWRQIEREQRVEARRKLAELQARIREARHRVRASFLAERQYQQELRRIEHTNRQRRCEAPRVTRLERRSESDHVVRANIPPELVGMFERVKKSIKATPRMSRTVAFLCCAEEHPSEVLDAIEDKTEALIRELEQQARAAAREMKRPRVTRSPREMSQSRSGRRGREHLSLDAAIPF